MPALVPPIVNRLLTPFNHGMECHMRAASVVQLKHELGDGAIIEMVVWKVPQRIQGSHHGFKYRLYVGKGGRKFGLRQRTGKGRSLPYPGS
jgi:hypothetical protein